MITSDAWAGKRYAVLGLARSGAATVRALVASGARVVAWDSDDAARNAILPDTGRGTSEAGGGGVPAATTSPVAPPLHHSPEGANGPPPRTGEDLVLADPELIDLTGFDAIIISPGVPLNRHPIAAKARAAGVSIIGDIELFAQARAGLPPHKVIGVTGTNGKSTTVSLIHHILQTAGVPSRLGGNIGLPILEQEPLPEGGVYVLELSSYQIDLTQSLDCDVAVLLNVTPDHLDRYGGFDAYFASKARLFKMQSFDHVGVISIDDPKLDALWLDVVGGPGQWAKLSSKMRPDQAEWSSLQGPHNAQNAAAALAVTLELGVHYDQRIAGLRTFRGLPHRMERVATRNGVAFINDSKATNPESTARHSLHSTRIHWILGGQAKSDDLDACAPSFGHVAHAYTIGEAGPRFAAILRDKVPVEESGTLATAVTSAAARARSGETVLLSPACASFDQFRDFEDRGDQFRQLVEALA